MASASASIGVLAGPITVESGLTVNAGSGKSQGKPGAAGRFAVPVRRFRIQAMNGETIGCEMHGAVRGVVPGDGDIVRVAGRRAEDGHYVVRYLDILASPSGPVVSRFSRRAGMRHVLLRWGAALFGRA